MDFVIYDTEYTTWEGAMARHWYGKDEYKEIIQIGALKISYPEFKVVDSLSLFIKPQKNPILSDYCKNLTGITQQDIDNGLSFEQGLKRFLDFVGDNLVGSYGNDCCVMAENTALIKANPLTLYGANFINLRFWINNFNNDTAKINSGHLWNLVPLPHIFNHTREHDALCDCYSIAEMLYYMHKQKFPLPFI